MQSLSHDSSKPRPSVKLGGDYLELTAEEERRLISKQGHRVAPQLNGVHYHFQLLDLFAISSVDPNYAYLTTTSNGTRPTLTCVNLKTGEWRPLSHLWSAWSLHCVCTGFGYVAVVTSRTIYIAEEGNWSNFWSRNYLTGNHMLNSCVLTKLLGEDGQPDEVVLIVGSNGGAVYTCSLPKVIPDEYILVDLPSEEELANDPGVWTELGEGINQSGVPQGQRRVLKHTQKQDIEIKQCLIYAKKSEDAEGNLVEDDSIHLANINCLAQGKGTYTDYLVGAPDYETRLYIFIRSYDGKSEKYWQNADNTNVATKDAKEVIFELVEQQHNPQSVILPIGAKPMSTWVPPATMDQQAYRERRQHLADTQPNSLNLAWAPWFHRSIIAAGTDSNRLIIYDFDEAQRLLCENEPNHIFDYAESKATVLFEAQMDNAVRLLKFSPVPSVPILAVCETTTFITFIDCRTWRIERVALPKEEKKQGHEEADDAQVCGMAWSADASILYVSTTAGIFVYRVKLLPSLSDRIMIDMVQNRDSDPADLDTLDNRDEMAERFNLMSFGLVRDKNATVDWMDMEKLLPAAVVRPVGSHIAFNFD